MSYSEPIFKVTIKGQVRAKKNNKRIFPNKNTGKTVVIPSNLHEKWHKSAMIQVLQKGHYGFTKESPMLGNGLFHVVAKFFCEDEKPRDASNMMESVMDLLVDLNIISDDKRQVCPSVHPIAAWTDRANPRVEIFIYNFDISKHQ